VPAGSARPDQRATAAALLAHRIGRSRPIDEQEYVLVFDLGGGTLDATVLEIHRAASTAQSLPMAKCSSADMTGIRG
jgi:molecular chaperone DnaK (HSP70)